MLTQEEIQKARTDLINTCFQTIKTLSENLDKSEPILKTAIEKVVETETQFKQVNNILREIKNLDPIPIEEYRKVKMVCIKTILDLHIARDFQNSAKTGIDRMRGELTRAKKNYENAVKEPQAKIFLFPGTD